MLHCTSHKGKKHYGGIFEGSRSIGGFHFRYFQKAEGCGGGAAVLRTALTWIMFCNAAKLLNRPEWFALTQRQLDFILGSNPFNLSFMRAIGYNNLPEYVFSYTQPRVPYIPGAVTGGMFKTDLIVSRELGRHFRVLLNNSIRCNLANLN